MNIMEKRGTGEARSDRTGLVIDEVTHHCWDDVADVVVVGFGGAGTVAALEARSHGVDVIALDRFGGGGATAYSGGTYYAGGGTRYQREAGIDDTPEEMFKYLAAEGAVVANSTLREFCEGSAADLEWIDGHGVPHGSNVYEGKTAFPPNGYWLFYSGNELLPGFRDKARPAPRGHRVRNPGSGGHVHYAKLKEAALRAGVRLFIHAPAQRLIVDRKGRVVGVRITQLPKATWPRRQKLYDKNSPWKLLNAENAEAAVRELANAESSAGITISIRARKGVILATGGFVYNLAMVHEAAPVLADNYAGLLRLGSLGCDGSGIDLGRGVGGRTSYMSRFYLGRPLSPPEAFVHGIIVNQEGQRFINEDAYQTRFGDTLMLQPANGRAWLILDRRAFWRGIRQILLPKGFGYRRFAFLSLINIMLGGTRSARSPDILARKCGINAQNLERTLADYNGRIEDQKPDPLGKLAENSVILQNAPYYAVNVSLSNRYGPTFCFSLGGLDVNENTGEVLNADGAAIKGLYAAGRAAVGLCSGGYMTGLSIADTVFSGRRAGKHAALITEGNADDAAA